MIEIKFRGKREDNGEWIYGSLLTPVGIMDIYEISDCNTVDGSRYEIERNTIGQYTGLKDKNGKEIYEGDILKIPEWLYADEQEKCICIYDQQNQCSAIIGFGLYIKDNYSGKYKILVESDEWDEFEVIR